MNKGKDGVERFYDSGGLTSIRVKNDGRAWSHDHHWTEFQKAVALSGVCTDREAYISAAMFEEFYVVYVTKPAIGWRVKTHVFIRFANGAWGLVDPSAYTNYLVGLEVELGNVYRVAVELYDAIDDDLRYGLDVLRRTKLLEGHHIGFEYNGIMGRTLTEQMSLREVIDHVHERNSAPTTWGLKTYNDTYVELLLTALLVGQSHAGHVIMRMIPEDFLGMYS